MKIVRITKETKANWTCLKQTDLLTKTDQLSSPRETEILWPAEPSSHTVSWKIPASLLGALSVMQWPLSYMCSVNNFSSRLLYSTAIKHIGSPNQTLMYSFDAILWAPCLGWVDVCSGLFRNSVLQHWHPQSFRIYILRLVSKHSSIFYFLLSNIRDLIPPVCTLVEHAQPSIIAF